MQGLCQGHASAATQSGPLCRLARALQTKVTSRRTVSSDLTPPFPLLMQFLEKNIVV